MNTPPETKAGSKSAKIMNIAGNPVVHKAALVVLGYAISYLGVPFSLLLLFAAAFIYLDKYDDKHSEKIRAKAVAYRYDEDALMKRMDEIPSWVKFPDKEKVEWLNQIIEQLWPTVDSQIVKFLRNSVEKKLRKKYDGFRFESIDFGRTPIKIDTVKVYPQTVKDCIIIDFEIFYDGDCDIDFSVSGANVGGIKNFQLTAEARLILKPLLPTVGGIQLYFLNTPCIHFTLDGLTGIPGLKSFLRKKLEDKISKKMVFPNKITKRFSKSVDHSELKALEVAGVLRVNVIKAEKLVAKDFDGKSDPYAILHVGAQERKTKSINNTVNPCWDYWCEFVIIDPRAQYLGITVFDKDIGSEDDFLGRAEVEVSSVLQGKTKQAVQLRDTKHGWLHLSFTWFSLSNDVEQVSNMLKQNNKFKDGKLSTALLTVYVDSAKELLLGKHGVKPQPYFTLQVNEQKEKSRVKKHTNAPSWEQGFVLLVANPFEDTLQMFVTDKSSGNTLGQMSYRVVDLLKEENFEISKGIFTLSNGGSLVMSLQLQILSTTPYDGESDESESDSDESISRQSSVEDSISIKASPSLEAVKLVRHNSGEYNLGRLELSFSYSDANQLLQITVHQISNLQRKSNSDIPDPYVRLKMLYQQHGIGPIHRTKVVVDSCNPTYGQTFEYNFRRDDLPSLVLLATVKSKKFFNNDHIGQVELDLEEICSTMPHRAWFDLAPKIDKESNC